MPINMAGYYHRAISRFDQFPFQVQALRETSGASLVATLLRRQRFVDSTKFVSAAQDAQTSFELFLNQIGTSTSGPTLKTNPNSTMHVSTYKDEGPYYAASRAVLGVCDLTDLIFNVREAMEQR